VLPLGEFTVMIPEPHATLEGAVMSSQSHVSRCRVGLLPLGEFTGMTPKPYATLQSIVTWRNQCHDRATLQGVRIPAAILKNRFSPYFIFFCFVNAVWAAFVSSPIHLFLTKLTK